MTKPSRGGVLALCAATAAFVVSADAVAEDVAKKFRIGGMVGVSNGRSVIESDAANSLAIVDNNALVIDIIADPRNDSAALNELTIETAPKAMISVDYAINSFFVIQASVGYQRGNVGPVDVQAQFANQPPIENRPFDFHSFNVDAGTLEQVPFQVTAIARFRPKKSFNPYFGIGGGYTWVGFEPTDELDQLSRNLSVSRGSIAYITSNFGQPSLFAPEDSLAEGLSGATIETPSALAWHIAGGFEVSFKKQWVVVTDIRYVFSSGDFRILFNGQDSLGISVPEGVRYGVEYGGEELRAGPMYTNEGGLVDAGRIEQQPVPGNPNELEDVFVFEPDGVVDSGFYYVQGGKLKFDGLSVLVGVKYTF